MDLPEPLGPTTAVMPGSSRRVVDEAKDLKPLIVNVLRCTAPTIASLLGPPGAAHPRRRCRARSAEEPPVGALGRAAAPGDVDGLDHAAAIEQDDPAAGLVDQVEDVAGQQDGRAALAAPAQRRQIGRASCRERV